MPLWGGGGSARYATPFEIPLGEGGRARTINGMERKKKYQGMYIYIDICMSTLS